MAEEQKLDQKDKDSWAITEIAFHALMAKKYYENKSDDVANLAKEMEVEVTDTTVKSTVAMLTMSKLNERIKESLKGETPDSFIKRVYIERVIAALAGDRKADECQEGPDNG